MDSSIALILVQDGVVNGAIYALLALSLVLVFAVTRVIFIPQGEFVAYGALTYAALDSGHVPASLWLMCVLAACATLAGLWAERHVLSAAGLARLVGETVLLPCVVVAFVLWLGPRHPGVAVEALLSLAIVAPMAPYLYRIAYQKLAASSALVLLIVSVAVHLVLEGLGLLFFGAEGFRATGFSTAVFTVDGLSISGQSIWIVGATLALMVALYLFFARSLTGLALRATAVNRLGARLVGIPTEDAGRLAFTLAGLIGSLCGVLIAPLTTVYYNTGFLVGLKGFVAAIIAGLASYPLAALAAVVVGLVESFSEFWASAFKEVIVFTVIIPVLLWRSFRTPQVEDES
jgi:branched-chain amino acid transport system permease protein